MPHITVSRRGTASGLEGTRSVSGIPAAVLGGLAMYFRVSPQRVSRVPSTFFHGARSKFLLMLAFSQCLVVTRFLEMFVDGLWGARTEAPDGSSGAVMSDYYSRMQGEGRTHEVFFFLVDSSLAKRTKDFFAR